jgi:uncharacterized membrane protein YeaQ/YmgE (transglycosylase-associated protein family)
MVITTSLIIGWIITGLVIGGLGRLVVPGRQRIGILLTLLIGIAGALIGGIITLALLGAGHTIITFIVSVVLAALLVSAVSSNGYRSVGRGRARRRIRW